jgi:hypothetical protein
MQNVNGYNLPLTDNLLIFQAISICMANFFPITPFLMNLIIGDDFKSELRKFFCLSKNDEIYQ